MAPSDRTGNHYRYGEFAWLEVANGSGWNPWWQTTLEWSGFSACGETIPSKNREMLLKYYLGRDAITGI